MKIMRKKMLDATVAICTFNRADLLDQTLQSLTTLQIPHDTEWELLIIDNRCTDHTQEVIKHYESRLPIRTCIEETQGISHARNRAIDEALGNIVLFLDDDVIADENVLTEHLRAANKWPEAGFFAGSVFPWYEKSPPPVLKKILDELANGAYLGVNQGATERLYSERDSLRCMNLSFRQSAISGIRFDPAFGRDDKDILFGEELDYCNKILEAGFHGVCLPTAKITHFVPAERVEFPYLKRFYHGLGLSAVRAGEIADGRRFFRTPAWILRKLIYSFVAKFGAKFSRQEELYLRLLTQQWFLSGVIQAIRKPVAKTSSVA